MSTLTDGDGKGLLGVPHRLTTWVLFLKTIWLLLTLTMSCASLTSPVREVKPKKGFLGTCASSILL